MDMQNSALSPLDSRYAKIVTELTPIFSEVGLVKNRLAIETQYVLFLLNSLSIAYPQTKLTNFLTSLVKDFSPNDFTQIKKIETKVRHDVKAVEYWLAKKFKSRGFSQLVPFIHFGLTSEDINNLAQSLQLKAGCQIILNSLIPLLTQLNQLSLLHKDTIMLGRTHGQPAIPTTFGKELMVYTLIITEQADEVSCYPHSGKLTGAVGTLAAHHLAYPKIDWLEFNQSFITSLNLKPVTLTTQILPGQYWTNLFSLLDQLSLTLTSLCQDIWLYISFSYLDQKVIKSEVGSSTMPQKINPIDFENAEGNSQLASSLFTFFISKFSHSRLQRDLSDSTIRRNFGTAFGHLLIAIKSLNNGLERIEPNQQTMLQDLNNHPQILAEAYQTLLRSNNIPHAYDLIKKATRDQHLNLNHLIKQLQKAKVPPTLIDQIKSLKPESYIGYASQITSNAHSQVSLHINKIKKENTS